MTATQQILAALIDSPEPLTRYNLAMRHDVLLEPDQISRSLHKLNQRGFIECVGMKEAEHVTKGRKPEAKAYKITQKGIDYMQEQQTNEPDNIDQQLIEAIREREAETVEALIDEQMVFSREFDDELLNDQVIDSGDPVVLELSRVDLAPPRIQDGAKLAMYLRMGADLFSTKTPLFAQHMRSAANALEEFSA